MTKLVYLYGPITGKDYAGAQGWRDWMADALRPHGITAVSPLRAKHYLASLATISGHGREYSEMGVLSTQQAVLARDKFDVLRADMLVGNFLDADRVSMGSMFEQAWAHLHHKPIAAAVPLGVHPHDHMFFNATVGFKVHTLGELKDVVVATLK